MRKPTSNLIVLALAAGVLVASPAPASAANGRIAFTGGRGGDNVGLSEIWSVLPGGGAAENLTKSADAVDVDPAWDPTGAKIAFSRQEKNSETFDLFVMNSDGTSKSKIKITGAANNRQPDWSPTGAQIAFVRALRANDTSNIFVVNPDGTGLGQLTDTAAPGYDAAPVWSPTGTQIAFVSDRAGSPQLFLMDSAGAAETQLTFDPCWASNPSWKPDGSQIVYERQCPGARADIYTVGTTSPATPAPLVEEDASDHQPAYAPDGDQIVFTRMQPNGDKDLFTVPAAGGPATGLASNTPQLDMSADWGTNVTARALATSELVPRAAADRSQVRAPDTKKKKKKKHEPKRFKVVPGVRYSRFRRQGSDVHLLKVSTEGPVTIDAALSNDRLLNHETTSHMAKRHGAVAAINGDFGLPSTGRTAHTFAEDGDLKQLSFAVAWNFAITADEKQTFFQRPQETVTAEEDDGWRVERWNFGQPGANDIAGYTPAGRGLEEPPANACSARLTPAAGPRWAPAMAGVETPYTVDVAGCTADARKVNGAVVLAAQPGSDGAILLESLQPGEAIDISWTLGWNGVADSVGGTPLLVEDSQIVAENCSESLCNRNPRTVVGINAKGQILLAVVEGRTKDSRGATLLELAGIMRGLHATFALNLDGGGSSTMVVNGKLMNEPSDDHERPVSSAILVLNGPDAEEQLGAEAPPATAIPTGKLSGLVGRAALLDPGSTGGLLEAMAAGTFGPPVHLPAELRLALRRFRSSR
jgi:Tol biopolymer transport system component/exopolysaccharide biosynthesis protein